MNSSKLDDLKRELAKVRQMSLEATRHNDFVRVANLTVRAAQINRAIAQVQDELTLAAL